MCLCALCSKVERVLAASDKEHIDAYKKWVDLPEDLHRHPYYAFENRHVWVVREDFKLFTKYLLALKPHNTNAWLRRKAEDSAVKNHTIKVPDGVSAATSAAHATYVPPGRDGPSTPKRQRLSQKADTARVVIDLTLSPAMERIMKEDIAL
ncbi:hypothetical protein CVT26_004589 [Gymnopilus dilepis]|uniref:Uncharacterized protein n=1 Tax=Gymnopilus dilepis TaxID=231916 RepID=A0A409WC76_9AGAR|nr:hypothetical protein CVT26_004589 [Gymnopilus dilepis]